MVFVRLRKSPLYLFSSRVFFMKGCWTLSKCISASFEMMMWFFFLFQFIYCAYLFMCAEPLLHPWDENYLMKNELLHSIFQDLIEDLHLCSLMRMSCSYFLVGPCFWNQGNVSFQESLWEYFILFCFIKEFERYWHKVFFDILILFVFAASQYLRYVLLLKTMLLTSTIPR